MLSHSGADQAGAAKEAPRSRVYRWSSDRQPKTRPSAASLCYEKWSVRSPKFAADNRHIASGSVSPIHKHSGSRIEDTQNHPASGWRPSTFDKPLRWRSATEIRARFWKTSGEPPDYTTPWGLLKQPDKHELPTCKSGLRQKGKQPPRPTQEPTMQNPCHLEPADVQLLFADLQTQIVARSKT